MGFRFRIDESIAAGFRRIASSQISRGIRHLAEDEDQAIAIHEARKCLKRVRALLRLVQPALGAEHYSRENARFRDIGRMLAASRDRHVLRQTIAALAVAADPPQQAALQALTEVVSRDANEDSLPVDTTQAIEAAIAALEKARKDFKKLRPDFSSGDVIRDGVKRTYRAAQKALEIASVSPDDGTLHEWRKTVQTHWRHMLLLSEAWPEFFALRANAAKDLADMLGEDHDLAVLMDFVASGENRAIGPDHAEAVIALASDRQRRLRSNAFASGAFLFAEDAKVLSKRISRYWHEARSRGDTDRPAGDLRRNNGLPPDARQPLAKRTPQA